MNRKSRKSIITVVLLFLSPLLSWFLTPITMIPAAIIGSIITRDCKGSMCGLFESIFITAFLNVVAAYIISLGIYLLTHKKEKLRKKVTVASLVLLYYAALVSGFILFARHEQGKLERKNLQVIKSLQELEAEDISFIERTAQANKTNWKTYVNDTMGYRIKYPNNFSAPNHKASADLYFRCPNKSYPSSKSNLNNQFFAIKNLGFQYIQLSNDIEAINYVVEQINKENVKTPAWPKKIRQPIEKSFTSQGWVLYFIEKGHRQTTKDDLEFNELSIIIYTQGKGYLFWEGYTTFEGGLELIKQVAEALEEI